MIEFFKEHWLFLLFVAAVLAILFIGANSYLDAATGMLPGVEGTGDR